MLRTEGVVLVARKDSEFWFIDSVFEHSDGLSGCTGVICYPVSDGHMDDLLEIESVEERYEGYWGELYKGQALEECAECNGSLQEEGCGECDYLSLRSLCQDIIDTDGVDAMVDDPGEEYSDAIKKVGEDAEYADTSGCGRIFSSYGNDEPMSPDNFDEVYNRKALVACLAFEDGAINYAHAARVIFGTIAG